VTYKNERLYFRVTNDFGIKNANVLNPLLLERGGEWFGAVIIRPPPPQLWAVIDKTIEFT
jgi:hypothetical protein